MKLSKCYRILTQAKLTVFAVIIGILLLSVQAQAKDLTGGKVDKVDVVYAVDGYLVDPSGNQKDFLFGAVKLHKRGAPEDEWAQPLFYFEFDNKRTLAMDTEYDYFTMPGSDGTLEIQPYLKGIKAVGSNFEYARYNKEEYAQQGLSEGSTPHDFEINLAFTRNGDIDSERSSIGIVPKEYQTGRQVKKFGWSGDYYKKGSKTERFIPQRDEDGKIINKHEAGELVFEESLVNINEVCYESAAEAAIPAPGITPLKEKNDQQINSPDITPPPAPDITPSLSRDKKEDPSAPEDKASRTTGLCSIYKVYGISRSTGLPDAYALGLIEAGSRK